MVTSTREPTFDYYWSIHTQVVWDRLTANINFTDNINL